MTSAVHRLMQSAPFAQEVTLIQESAGSWDVNNVWVPGAENRTTITVATYPATDRPDGVSREMMQQVGSRLGEMRVFLIGRDDTAPLRIGSAATNGDRIEYNNVVYSVIQVKHYALWNNTFDEVLTVREDGQ